MKLADLTQKIIQQIPCVMLPTIEDGEIFRRHADFFLKHEAVVVDGFYDIVYNDSSLNTYLSSEERPARENTLRQWYQVTTKGYFDESYLQWQVLVGIVHVKHKIPNSALLGMWGWMQTFLQQRMAEELPVQESTQLITILQKLQTTVCSLIVESFIATQQEAIFRSSGLKPTIMERFVDMEVNALLMQGRMDIQQTRNTQAVA